MTSHIPITMTGVRQGVRMCLPYVPGYFIMGATVAHTLTGTATAAPPKTSQPQPD